MSLELTNISLSVMKIDLAFIWGICSVNWWSNHALKTYYEYLLFKLKIARKDGIKTIIFDSKLNQENISDWQVLKIKWKSFKIEICQKIIQNSRFYFITITNTSVVGLRYFFKEELD